MIVEYVMETTRKKIAVVYVSEIRHLIYVVYVQKMVQTVHLRRLDVTMYVSLEKYTIYVEFVEVKTWQKDVMVFAFRIKR